MEEREKSETNLTPTKKNLEQLWEEHVRHEFSTHNTEATLATMVEEAYVNHIPVLTGGVGKDELREFYSKRFIPQMPPDTEMTTVSRTVADDQLVDEMVFKFTHTIPMDWMLPGVAPTGKRVEVPLVAIVRFRKGKLAHEHIYWDQASVLVQLGLLDPASLPIVGVESARKALDPSIPSNALMRRAEQGKRARLTQPFLQRNALYISAAQEVYRLGRKSHWLTRRRLKKLAMPARRSLPPGGRSA
jgi:carboxymethylenebutenolidase